MFKVFAYLGTAYSQSDKLVIDENLYPLNYDWRQIITIAESAAIDDDLVAIFTEKYEITRLIYFFIKEHVHIINNFIKYFFTILIQILRNGGIFHIKLYVIY